MLFFVAFGSEAFGSAEQQDSLHKAREYLEIPVMNARDEFGA